ncbi:MAG: glycosyltransferase [Acetobacteraceae bacterium]|nr:glycosyltransferase [Acetobacteraceae bacterium]
MGTADRVIGVSGFVTQSMIRRGIPARKVRTVLNGTIHSPRSPGSPSHAAILSRPAILHVGGLHPRKGVDDLIKAFAIICRRFPEAHLYLVGSGPHQAEYEALARDVAPAGRVVFRGHTDDPGSYMRGADIFVLASRSEPASLVLSEAREAGCAVVATDVGGNKEMLENGAAGILVPPDRPDLLANALSDLLGEPQCLAEAKARSQINIEKMSLRRVAAETEQVYREILEDARAHRDAGARARNVIDAH